MRLSFQQIKEEFKRDLNLAKYYLLNEAIEDSVKKTIQIIGLTLVQKLQASEAAKKSKLKTLLASAVTANKLYVNSLNIQNGKNLNDYKRIAGGVVSAIEFYFLMEDLLMVLTQEYVKLKEKHDEFLQTQEGTKEEIDQNPTVDIFLNPNDFGRLKITLLKVLDSKNALTKDIQTVKFKKATSDVNAKPIIEQSQKQRIVFEIGKLTLKEYENLINTTKTIVGLIKFARISIGNALPQEIRKKFLGADDNDKTSIV